MAQTFTVKGTATPYTTVDIAIGAELYYTTTADAKGNWRYIITKPLSEGKKELIVSARNVSGVSTEYKQAFQVRKSSLSWLLITLLVLTAIGGLVYVFYKRQQ